MEKRKLIWDEHALVRLEASLRYISETSTQQAEQVEQTILEKIDLIRVHPERFPPDKYKRNNSGSYRALEINSYRISYHYTEHTIRILRFRHVKQDPSEY